MYNFNKRQKIAIGLIVGIVATIIFYYVYAKEENYEIVQDLEIVTSDNKKEIKEEEINKIVDVVVHISGAVNNEGIIKMKEDSRIADAIDKAGGLKENANISNINLAYMLEDGMKVHIPTNEEQKELEKENSTQNNEGLIANKDQTTKYIVNENNITGGNKINNVNSQNSKVNINTATQTALETLPGIGPSTALKIINYRKENGKFSSIEDIKNVNGIGESKYENIKGLITN